MGNFIMEKKTITYGMVGGSNQAFIGDVHRKAIALDGRAKLVAGCFSSNPDHNRETGETNHISPDRLYSDYQAMAKTESTRPDKIDFVSITTPNHTHYAIAKEFLLAGINVVCEKPLCFTVEQAEELKKISEEKGLIFAVTYAYTGYTMVKVAREMIADGKIGKIININAEYAQDWLLDEISENEKSSGKKFSFWRMDPEKSGISNCTGDIGTHMENMVHYLTGLKIKRLHATINRFGHALDLNANMIVEYENHINGGYWCSQLAAGHKNGFVVRVFGTEGGIEWMEEFPDYLKFTPRNSATQILSRSSGYITEKAASYGRLPAGHPEGYIIAFANTYKNIISTILKKNAGETPSEEDLDFQTVTDGLNGVKFVHAVIESADNDSKWVTLD